MIQLKCFHGTSYNNAISILHDQHFRKSDTDKSRMGVGAYFFCQAGNTADYALRCARELEKFHRKKKHPDGYGIISCDVECDDEEYLDLYSPEALETFHSMRYLMLNRSLKVDPEYKYKSAAVADTQVFNVLRDLRKIAVIRCPQFFGMFEEEKKFEFREGPNFPKTYVPNVIMACVDTDIAIVKNIKLVEGERYDNEHEQFI